MSAAVRQFLLDLNGCWVSGDLHRLSGFYHPSVVLLPPDLGEPIRGRDAVLASYQDFARSARLLDFDVTDLAIESFPAAGAVATHVAHMRFDVSYELEGDHFVETGLEIYTVQETVRGLQVVWRAQLVLDSRIAEKSDRR